MRRGCARSKPPRKVLDYLQRVAPPASKLIRYSICYKKGIYHREHKGHREIANELLLVILSVSSVVKFLQRSHS